MKKILVVFGTRPEAIKMCPLINELKNTRSLDVKVLVTGQHLHMLKQVLDIFNIIPDYNLSIMRENQTLFDITSCILNDIKDIYEKESPDLILVHGDTTTSFTAALAAFYKKIPVGHVEAGLRTDDIYSPYPEEFNRRSISLISKFDFAPTATARENLIREGKNPVGIWVTGNTVIDALKTTVTSNFKHPQLDWANDSRLIFITAHRRENLGQPMHNMFKAIRTVLESHPDTKALYPIHMNPAVREIAKEHFDGFNRIHLCEPVDVIECHNIMAKSYLILTDSGGIQEEAPSLGKPVLVMRDTTERPEGIAAGTCKLVGSDTEKITKEFSKLLDDPSAYNAMSKAINPYGDGNASARITDIILKNL